MSELAMIFIGAALIHNVVLTQFLGADSFFGVSGQVKASVIMGAAVTFLLTVVSAVASLLQEAFLTPWNLDFLKTFVFVLITVFLSWGLKNFLQECAPDADKALSLCYPYLVANTAVLGVALTNAQNGYGFGECLLSGLGAGLGYAVVLFLFACIRAQVREDDVPETLRGAPIVLLAAALMSIAFMGFANLA